MKSKLNRFFVAALAAITITLFACTPPAQAQITGSGVLATITDGATYILAGNSVSNNAAAIDCSQWREITLLCTFALNGAGGTTNVDIRWCVGTDATNKCTVAGSANKSMFSIPANGTTTAVLATNITLGSLPYFYLDSISNGNAQVVTNLHTRILVKRSLDTR